MSEGKKIFITTLMTLILSPVFILVFYIQWGELHYPYYKIYDPLRTFNKWPWFRGSLVLTSITFLYPFFAIWLSRYEKNYYQSTMHCYGALFLWIGLLMFYPGHSELGLDSDPNGAWTLVLLWFLHYVASWIIGREAWKLSSPFSTEE